MNITERDIFFYHRYPDQLTQEKKEYIEKHLGDFKVEFDFLEASGLKASKTNNIRLYRKVKAQDFHDKKLRLAAANNIEQTKDETETFIDKEEMYIAKILSFGSYKLIYIFDKTGQTIDNIKIRLLPENFEHFINPGLGYLEIKQDTVIDELEITSIRE